jgi:signal transduction histidine kinase
MAKVKQGQSIAHFETEQLRKDGSTVPVSLTVSPIKDTAERLIGISSIARDITSYRCAQEAIEAKNRELQRLSGQLLRSQDEERRRIARELHDGAAQVLAGLSLNLAKLHAMPLLQECEEARRRIDDSLRLASEGGRELRSLSYVLHPPLLDELGLRSALESYAEGFAARTGIATRLDLPDLERLPADVEIALFRIVQESLANAHRHSGTRRVEIRGLVRPEGLAMEIADSGKGLGAAPAATEPTGIKFGVGILGMQERARQLGGELTLTSRPGETVVRVWLPLEQHATA